MSLLFISDSLSQESEPCKCSCLFHCWEKPNEPWEDGENKEEDKGPKIDNNVTIPTIDSIDVTTIPIEVKGTFFKVRDYLKFLDELGLIEPSSVKMTTDGMEVTAEITLNIFHWKGED